ncbi:hypothetical protein VNO77_23064 [Canavalia gladiata]|uniref:Uncharacterized protein n=1 Tax=Canavalia gladiata TaxID=3824 RepID=A0AAN9QB69_CANGL
MGPTPFRFYLPLPCNAYLRKINRFPIFAYTGFDHLASDSPPEAPKKDLISKPPCYESSWLSPQLHYINPLVIHFPPSSEES